MIESIEVKFLFDDLVSAHLVSVTKISKLKPLTLSDEEAFSSKVVIDTE